MAIKLRFKQFQFSQNEITRLECETSGTFEDTLVWPVLEIQGVHKLQPIILHHHPTASLRATARRRSPGHLPEFTMEEILVTTFLDPLTFIGFISLGFLVSSFKMFQVQQIAAVIIGNINKNHLLQGIGGLNVVDEKYAKFIGHWETWRLQQLKMT